MALPMPQHFYWKGDQIRQVLAVTKADILLYDEESGVTERVPLYAWEGWAEMPDPGADVQVLPPIRAILIGGEAGQHLIRLKTQAADLGVDIDFHIVGSTGRYPARYPAGVELAIFLQTHIGRAVAENMVEMAKRIGLPFIYAPSGGFQEVLRREMVKIGLTPRSPPERLGGLEPPVAPTWEWDETEASWELSDERPASDGGDFGVAGLLVLGLLGVLCL